VSVWATFVASLILFFILNNTVWVCGHLWRALSFYSKQHGVSVWTFFVASHFIFYSEQHGVSVWTSFVASHFILNNTVWVCGRLFVASFSSEQQCECVDVFCGLSHFILNITVWVCGRLLWPLSFSSEQHCVSVWTSFAASFSSEQHCVSVRATFVAALLFFWTTQCKCVELSWTCACSQRTWFTICKHSVMQPYAS
jgi:ABC-type sulfate transport system permease component